MEGLDNIFSNTKWNQLNQLGEQNNYVALLSLHDS